jgi:hypothetical protein
MEQAREPRSVKGFFDIQEYAAVDILLLNFKVT